MAAHTSVSPSSLPLVPPPSVAVESPTPFQIVRRDGSLSPFDPSKISVAITKAFLAVEGTGASGSTRIHEAVEAAPVLTMCLPQR